MREPRGAFSVTTHGLADGAREEVTSVDEEVFGSQEVEIQRIECEFGEYPVLGMHSSEPVTSCR